MGADPAFDLLAQCANANQVQPVTPSPTGSSSTSPTSPTVLPPDSVIKYTGSSSKTPEPTIEAVVEQLCRDDWIHSISNELNGCPRTRNLAKACIVMKVLMAMPTEMSTEMLNRYPQNDPLPFDDLYNRLFIAPQYATMPVLTPEVPIRRRQQRRRRGGEEGVGPVRRRRSGATSSAPQLVSPLQRIERMAPNNVVSPNLYSEISCELDMHNGLSRF